MELKNPSLLRDPESDYSLPIDILKPKRVTITDSKRRLPITKPKCPQCGKIAEATSTDPLFGVTLKCGHVITEAALKQSNPLKSIESVDGRKLFGFQAETILKGEKASGVFLCAHQMGLGKTVIGLGTLFLHPEMLPCVVVCKKRVKRQWFNEGVRWCGPKFVAQEIDTSQDIILPFFKLYIITFDMLARLGPEAFKHINGGKGPSCVIIDETQQIKNSSAKRTEIVRKFARNIPFRIGLSGTPIKRHALEYFTILNLLRPELFPTYAGFDREWVGYYWDGNKYKPGGIRENKLDAWKKLTEPFIFRYLREDVMKDLPVVKRDFSYLDIGDVHLQKAYEKAYDDFEQFYQKKTGKLSFNDVSNLLAIISRLRHITGLAKVQPTVEQVIEFLETTDRKAALFLHHHDVASLTNQAFKEWCKESDTPLPLNLTSDLSVDKAQEVIDLFTKDPKHRILIASTLSSGEGLNLQYQCNDLWLMERQWNPGDEEQVESRFTRPDSPAMHGFVNANYPTAMETIDEWMTEIVEKKRQHTGQAMGDNVQNWDETAAISELAAKLHAAGKPKWRISNSV